MSIVKVNSGLTLGDKPLFLIRLENQQGASVTLSNYGCLILSWNVSDAYGKMRNIVLGFDQLQDYQQKEYLDNYPYFGVLVGRYANRIKNARFTLDGQVHQLRPNKGNDQIHGGFKGFDRVVWELLELNEDENRVLFGYRSPDGEEGYPGNLELQVAYTLTEQNQLIQEIRGTTDRPTPVNLTHHDYFNLNGGAGTIADHHLHIPASAYLEQDANLVVTGNLVPVENTAHDFQTEKKIGLHLPQVGEYDQTFVLDKAYGAMTLAARLRSEKTGISLEVHTTEPVCHLYTGKWIPEIRGKQGQNYGPFSGLCLEVQHHPNAVNIPAFPSTLLLPGETYHQLTRYGWAATKN